jgi:hypothetical protein
MAALDQPTRMKANKSFFCLVGKDYFWEKGLRVECIL